MNLSILLGVMFIILNMKGNKVYKDNDEGNTPSTKRVTDCMWYISLLYVKIN